MNLEDIIKDGLHYPLSDMDTFIRLAIPNFILGLVLGLAMFLGMGYVRPTYNTQSIFLTSAILMFILLFIALIIVLLIDSGIMIDVMRKSINQDNTLPELNIKDNLVMGLKSFIVSLIYILVPMIIYSILVAVFTSILARFDYSLASAVALSITLIFYLLMLIISLMMPVVLVTLARTGSISEALDVKSIWRRANDVGFVKLFLLAIVVGIIAFILGLVGMLISSIPIIGFIITMGLIYTYLMLFNSRCNALLFVDSPQRLNEVDFNSTQYPQHTSQEQNGPEQGYDGKVNQINDDGHLDYKSQDESTPADIKICPGCGSVNPQDAHHCGQCGNKL